MNNSSELQIKKCEEILKDAMLQSDISALDKLLAVDLTFNNHLGLLMTKKDDLEAHKSKKLKINKITLSNQKIKIYDNTGIATVEAHIIGSFNGEESIFQYKNESEMARFYFKNQANFCS